MASHRFLPLLLAFGLAGALPITPQRPDKELIRKFTLADRSTLEFAIKLENLYGLLGPGPEPYLCMQLETATPVLVSVGFDEFTPLGVFGSQLIPLNLTFLENFMANDKVDKTVADDGISFRIQTDTVPSEGFAHIFKCRCVGTSIPYKRGTDTYIETECERAKTTWDDRVKEFYFYHHSAQVQREPIKMDFTIQSAVVDEQHTMCFEYKGDGLIHLTLSKCQGSQNLSMILQSDTPYSFSNKQKAILKTMHQMTCADGKEDWWLDVESFGQETVGYVNVHGCQRYLKVGESDDEGKPFKYILPNSGTTLDGIKFFFDLKEYSSGVYSADIKDFLDEASVVKNQSVALGVNISSSTPITVILTRCKNQTSGGIVIAKHTDDDYVSLHYTQLKKYKELSVRPTCDSSDENDALYLHVITTNASATGNVCFSLDATADDQKPLSTPSFPKVVFAMGNDSAIVKKLSIGDFFNIAYQAGKRVYFHLDTNLPVTIFLSKCRYTKRELLAGEPSPGTHLMTRFIVSRVNRVTSHSCGPNEDIGQDEVYVHLESPYGPVQGTFGFFMVNKTYVSNPMLDNFVPLDEDRKALKLNAPLEITTKDPTGRHPVEIDINAFAEEASFNKEKALVLNINRETNVTIYFSKCMYSHVNVPMFKITTGGYILNQQEARSLYDLTRRVQCDNVARNGVFLHITEPTKDDVVTIELVDLRQTTVNNGGAYSVKEKEPHTVLISAAPMDRGISIRVTNIHSKPVDLFVTMCPSLPEAAMNVSNGPLTTALVKLNIGTLKELKQKAKKCPAHTNHTLYFTIASPNAKGLITVERQWDFDCEKFNCSLGTVKYFADTSNLIIA